MKLIGISGKAGSGKNTFACILKDTVFTKYKVEVQLLAFAEPVKDVVAKMFPRIPEEYLYGASELRSQPISGTNPKTGKQLIVRDPVLDIGKLGRSYDPDFWIRETFLRINDKSDLVIFTDLRFPNEKASIEAGIGTEKGLTVRLVRDSANKTQEHVKNDESETSLTDADLFSFRIKNDNLSVLNIYANMIADTLFA